MSIHVGAGVINTLNLGKLYPRDREILFDLAENTTNEGGYRNRKSNGERRLYDYDLSETY